MQLTDFINECGADWALAGMSRHTIATYTRYLAALDEETGGQVTLAAVKLWLASATPEVARARARAVRAFARWAEHNDGPAWGWWRQVPLKSVAPTPQETVDERDYKRAVKLAAKPRDRLMVELLWCTGLRVSELARVGPDDINLETGSVLVRTSKTGKPRMAPLSKPAIKLLRRWHPDFDDGTLLGMTGNAIQQWLKHRDLPSPHAWRRGWAVRALRNGVSQASLQAAAGWSSGAMVTRYTAAQSNELALEEFRRSM